MRDLRGPLVAALVLAIALAGCAATEQDGDDMKPETSPVETAEVQEPSPEPEAEPWAAFTLSDSEGYELGVEINTVSASASSSIASAPPGFTDVSITSSAEATIQNLTPGREVPSAPGVDLLAAFEANSAMCTAEWVYWGPDGKESSRERLLRSSPAGCFIPIGGLAAMTTPPPDSDPIPFNLQELPSTYASPFLRVPEAVATAITAEIDSAPLFAAVGAGSSSFGWQPLAPVCQTTYAGWLGTPFTVAAAPAGVGCG